MRLAFLAALSLLAAPVFAQITAESENNNTESAADGPLGNNVNVSASIGSASDQDWYYFDVASPGNIDITLSHVSPRDYDFFLYRATGSYVLSGQSSARPETGTYYATSAERYWIKITRYASTGAYTLNVKFPSGGSATPTPTPTATPTPTTTATATATPTPTPSGGFGPRPALPSGLVSYVTGSAADDTVAPVNGPMVMLMGGSLEADAAFINRGFPVANGGDVVVLRTDNSNGYNDYLFNLVTGATKPDSVETIVVDTVTKANSDYVYWVLRSAELVFIGGGNQSTYINTWTGTKVVTGINEVYSRGGVVGGTSAGNHVMGRWIYDPDGVTAVISSEAIANPYRSSMIISDNLFSFPLTANIVTDTHFAQRDRMGRSLAFHARLRQDGRATSALDGVSVDERTCISIDKNGIGWVDGTNAVYILQEDASTVRQQCVSGQPLIYNQVKRTKLTNGQSFNFNTDAGGTMVRLSVNGGAATPLNPSNPY